MKLTKKTYLITDADKVIDRTFKEISKTQNSISVAGFFKMYKDIFFRIPKKGTNSHTTIYNDSGNYIENPQSGNKIKIKKLENKIKELELKLSKLEHKNEMLSSINVAQELEIKELKL
jgi:TolA-binding protein